MQYKSALETSESERKLQISLFVARAYYVYALESDSSIALLELAVQELRRACEHFPSESPLRFNLAISSIELARLLLSGHVDALQIETAKQHIDVAVENLKKASAINDHKNVRIELLSQKMKECDELLRSCAGLLSKSVKFEEQRSSSLRKIQEMRATEENISKASLEVMRQSVEERDARISEQRRAVDIKRTSDDLLQVKHKRPRASSAGHKKEAGDHASHGLSKEFVSSSSEEEEAV